MFQKSVLMVSKIEQSNRDLILQTLLQTQLIYRFRMSVGN